MLRKKLKVDADSAQSSNSFKEIEESKGQDSNQLQITFEMLFWEKIWKLEKELGNELIQINYKSDKNIAAIYNPLDYAAELHINFLKKFLKKAPEVLFLGKLIFILSYFKVFIN